MNPLKRLRRPRFELFGGTLSGRVLWFTTAVILGMELVILLPTLGRERQDWLLARVAYAHLAVYALAESPIPPDQPAIDRLLGFAGVLRVTLSTPGLPDSVWQVSGPTPATSGVLMPDSDSLLSGTWQALIRAACLSPRFEQVRALSPLQPGAVLVVTVDTLPLTEKLRSDIQHGFGIAVVVALLTGLLVYAVLNRLLVRPMQILTASITHFREDPEQFEAQDLEWLAARPQDDISTAARELKVMQEELRAALWRNARLAAVGTAVAKIAHDLRNILSSALLVADRLQEVHDPVVQRATKRLIPAVDHASQLVARTLDFTREGPPPITRSAVDLHGLTAEVAEMLGAGESGFTLDNRVPPGLVLPLDRGQLYRVLANLIRNAAEAGATSIAVSSESQGGVTRLRVSDDGPGLPLRVRENLFKPFTSSGRYGGTGLGLAIARDLVRAHGGDLVLEDTGPRGTVFCMDLSASEM